MWNHGQNVNLNFVIVGVGGAWKFAGRVGLCVVLASLCVHASTLCVLRCGLFCVFYVCSNLNVFKQLKHVFWVAQVTNSVN